MILQMMIPAIKRTRYFILGNEIQKVNQKILSENDQQIKLLKALFTDKDSNKIQISDDIPNNITEILHKPININIEINGEVHTIKDIYIKGTLKEYNKNIYIAQLTDKIDNIILIKKQMENIISSAIQAINIPEWNIGFSLNGFVIFDKPIESPEITNVDTYDKKENLIMVYQNDEIKYYDITKAFPEIADSFKFNLTFGAIGITLLGGLYLIMNNDDSSIQKYKQEIDQQIPNESENTQDESENNYKEYDESNYENESYAEYEDQPTVIETF